MMSDRMIADLAYDRAILQLEAELEGEDMLADDYCQVRAGQHRKSRLR